jgi:hypothetical protein
MNKTNKDWLTLDELRRKWDVSVGTITKWREEGLPCYKIGKNICFLDSEVNAFITEKMAVKPKEAKPPTESMVWNNTPTEAKVSDNASAKSKSTDDNKQLASVAV